MNAAGEQHLSVISYLIAAGAVPVLTGDRDCNDCCNFLLNRLAQGWMWTPSTMTATPPS
jgi:hypothetical protein